MLIAGARRLEACKLLNWKEVPVHVVPLDDLVKGEEHENTIREPFLPTEFVAISKVKKEREEAKAKERQGTRTDLGKQLPAESAESRDAVAALLYRSINLLDDRGPSLILSPRAIANE
jgi:ParB-like chromosome segregation protein Spo0J